MGGCYELLNFSGWLLVVRWVPSWVRSPHGAVSQDMLLCGPWVHPGCGAWVHGTRGSVLWSRGSWGGGGSHSTPEEIGTDGCARGPLRILGLSWGSVLGGGFKTWGWAGGGQLGAQGQAVGQQCGRALGQIDDA